MSDPSAPSPGPISDGQPDISRDLALRALRAGFEAECPLEESTWSRLAAISTLDHVEAGGFFCRAGVVPTSFGFVCRGLLRGYSTREDGHEYNKVFFIEHSFPGSMAALLRQEPTPIAIQALEDSWVMRLDFQAYRRLLAERPDLMWFQILYLERNWLLAKEPREISLVQETATQRYLRFRREHPGLERRLAQYHVASHLGITPTQLSRIRRSLSAGQDPGEPST